MGAPVRFQKAVPGSKEKRRGEAPIGAPVRVMGRLFPSAEGTGFAARRPPGAAFRTSACRRFAPSPGAMKHGSPMMSTKDEQQTPCPQPDNDSRKAAESILAKRTQGRSGKR